MNNNKIIAEAKSRQAEAGDPGDRGLRGPCLHDADIILPVVPQPRGAEERGDWGVSEVRKQSSKCEQLEKDQTQQQELLEIVHKQLVLIPELKSEIEKQQKPEAETSERPQLSSDGN